MLGDAGRETQIGELGAPLLISDKNRAASSAPLLASTAVHGYHLHHQSHLSLSLPKFLLSYSPSSSSSKPAFIDAATGATLTYDDLRALVASATRALAALGVRRGDVVLLVSQNSLHLPALVLAVLSLGAVLSTANFLCTRREIQSQVQDCNPVLILTTADLAPKLEGLLPRPLTLIERFLESLSVDRTAPIEFADVGPADPAVLMYSSGTTGKSKGVVSSHGNLVAMASVLRHMWGREEVYACVVPLFHMYGFSVFVCGAVAAGATVVVLRRFAVQELLKAVEKHRVTRLPAVPPMVAQLARSSGLARGYDLGSLKEVISSGAPLAREHMERFADGYPAIKLAQCYGLTETSGPITVGDGLEGRFQISIGRLIPSMEAKIVDVRTGKALPPNEHGELCVRGPPVMQGYLKNQEATSLAIDGERWLHTGDLCYIDSQGLVYVVERIKELIKYKAYQVAPAELEEVLSTHPDILDVAVTSYPDEEAGEIPMACIVRKAGSKIKEDDVTSFMVNKVAPYKKIGKVLFLESIARSPSGKILRRNLKDTVLQHQKIEMSSKLY